MSRKESSATEDSEFGKVLQINYERLQPERQRISLLPGKLRLIFGEKFHVNGNIDVLVRGILISSTPTNCKFQIGEFIDLPISYFPAVQLPAHLRICVGDESIADPITISSADDVMAIVGQKEIEIEGLALEGGVLRGNFVLRGNSVSIPNSYICINDFAVRSVVVEPPVARDSGGAMARFAVSVRSTDFVESGLSIDLYICGIPCPLASLSYGRVDPEGDHRRLTKLEEELRQARTAHTAQLEMLNVELERRLTAQHDRIDTFIEYLMSIMLDYMASEHQIQSDKTTFLQAISNIRQRSTGMETVAVPARTIRSATLEANSSHFTVGWYGLEQDDIGLFRWMGHVALISNPYPDLPIAKVELLIAQVYGAAEPLLRATADDVEFEVAETRMGDHYLITFSSPYTGEGVYANSFRIESFRSGCPASDKGETDTRTLSISALRANFSYAQSCGESSANG